MTMGLQDLMMFRDNLQQPAPTGMDNLRNLQALTIQGMAAEDYMNEPMMNTGLMSLPVAQAGFGGFVKSIARAVTRPVKAVAKGVSGLAKGVAGAVKNIAKSPIGQFGIPAAAMFFAPQLGVTSLLGKSALAGGTTGLTALLGGAKPEEAFKRGVIAGGLTYGGGKLFGAGGAKGVDKAIPTDSSSYVDFARANPVSPEFAVGSAAPDIGSATYGSQITDQLANVGKTGIDTAADSVFRSYQDVGDITKAVYPGSGAVSGPPPSAGIVDTIRDVGSSAIQKAGTALKAGFDFAQKNPIPTALGGAALLSGLGAGQQIPQDQLSMAGLTPVETDFNKQQFTYRDRQGNILTRDEALRMIQQASQNVGAGGQKQASGVTYGFDRVDDPVLSASGGLIGMMYGGQAMPENNMDVKYKEFSGMVGGRGDGMEDNVYMPIVEGESGQQVATLAVSPKEYVVDANTMSLLGNGNPDKGAEIMDKTVKDIRKKATGQTKQQKEIDGLAALNRMRRSV